MYNSLKNLFKKKILNRILSESCICIMCTANPNHLKFRFIILCLGNFFLTELNKLSFTQVLYRKV